jgi:UDP-glucose 4-epimerase
MSSAPVCVTSGGAAASCAGASGDGASAAAAAQSTAAASPIAASLSGGRSLRVLVTGGAGYIGSHTCVQLLDAGHSVIIVDDLSNSSRTALERIEEIAHAPAGSRPVKERIEFHQVDLRDAEKLEGVFTAQAAPFDACIHFAGLKAVGESVSLPLLYYEVNIIGTLHLLRALEKHKCKRVVFSSSATVYGMAEVNPIPETAPLSTTNPYGQTKLVIEGILRDVAHAPVAPGQDGWKVVILRYFNPIGAHVSGRIGEDPRGIPNNLLPFVMQVAVGRRAELSVFGNDYPTRDGTGVRDYLHVEDLAAGHLAAIEHGLLGDALKGKTCDEFNLGTGNGVSVLEVVSATEKATGRKIPYKFCPRRFGDIATCFADARKSNELLRWKAHKTLQQAVEDSWRWQSSNPEGFATKNS